MMKGQKMDRDNEEIYFSQLVRDSRVTEMWKSWNWGNIAEVLRNQQYVARKRADPSFQKYLKRILWFFCPQQGPYCMMSNRDTASYTQIAVQLIATLCPMEEGQRLLSDFLTELVMMLKGIHSERDDDDDDDADFCEDDENPMSPLGIRDRSSREYFTFLGTLSQSPLGQVLLKTHRVYSCLFRACQTNREDIIKLIALNINAHSADSQLILKKILAVGTTAVRKVLIDRLERLAMSTSRLCQSWILVQLVALLNDAVEEVALHSLKALEELCNDMGLLEMLIELQPALLHLGTRGSGLLTRFLSCSSGLRYLQDCKYVENELAAWHREKIYTYVDHVEEKLNSALGSHGQIERPRCHPLCDRMYRSEHALDSARLKAHLPVHFYGRLTKLKEGAAIIRESRHVEEFVENIRAHASGRHVDLRVLKASLWAIGKMSTSKDGMDLLPADLMELVVQMAETSTNLSLRGFVEIDLNEVFTHPFFPPLPLFTPPPSASFVMFLCFLISLVYYSNSDRRLVYISFALFFFLPHRTCVLVLGLFAMLSDGRARLNDLGWDAVKSAP